MSHPDPRCVLRIAIALALLKPRPRDRPIASYLLDVQAHFPFATEHEESRSWRTYALELEQQLTTLKAERDADQELLSKLPTDASQVASTSDAPPPKKKSKKNPAKDQHDPEWSWDQSRASWSQILASQYPSSPSLVAAYASLKGALAAPTADVPSYASRLANAIIRALDTIHLFLFSPTSPSLDARAQTASLTQVPLKPEHIDNKRIALASPLLMYLLRTALQALVRTAQDSSKSKRVRQRPHPTGVTSPDAHIHVDKVLGQLLERVLLPLVRTISPLCSARLAPLVSPPPKDAGKANRAGKPQDKNKDERSSTSVDPLTKTVADVRTDVFALLGTSLEALDALPALLVRSSDPAGEGGAGSIASDVRDRLGLETIRELEAVYAVPPSDPPPPTTSPQPPPPPSTPDPPSASESQIRLRVHQRRTSGESRAKLLEGLVGTREERVRALATRDAGWFLASTLNLCVGLTPTPAVAAAAAHGPAGRLLREALLDRVGKLVRSVHVRVPVGGPGVADADQSSSLDGSLDGRDTKFAMDPVCRNMLLAVCERAISHLASS